MKFIHADIAQPFKCSQCKSTFKHKKYLNAHLLNVHKMDQRKEDNWQDLPKDVFACEICKAKFNRKADLKVHIQTKHTRRDMFIALTLRLSWP